MNLTSPLRLQSIFWLALGGALVWLLVKLGPVLTPFLLGAMLAYMFNPAVDWLRARRWPRWLAAAAMVVAMLTSFALLALILVPVLQTEIGLLMERLPRLIEWFNTSLAPRLAQWFGWKMQGSSEHLKELIATQWNNNQDDIVNLALGYLRGGGSVVLTVFGLLFLVPIVLFYLLLDWHALLARFEQLIPRRWHPKALEIARETDGLLAQYLRGQLLVMLILALYYAVALKIAGVAIAIPVGILTGLLIFIPYLGYALGLVLALIAAALEPNAGYSLIAVTIVYGIGQAVESFFLTPRLVGERIGLHPVAVIFALLAFGQLFGFFGVLLALPASAALLVGLRHLRKAYLASAFYQQ